MNLTRPILEVARPCHYLNFMTYDVSNFVEPTTAEVACRSLLSRSRTPSQFIRDFTSTHSTQIEIKWNPHHSASPSRGNQEFRYDQRAYFHHQPPSAATVHLHQPSMSPLSHLQPTLHKVGASHGKAKALVPNIKLKITSEFLEKLQCTPYFL